MIDPISLGISGALGLFGASKERKARKAAEREAAAAEAAEREREERVRAAQWQVDRAFDSPAREAQRQQFAESLRTYLGQQLGRQQRDIARNQKFALARAGQIGGSVQRDADRRLGDEFAEATIANERGVQGQLADLRGEDERARLALRSAASQGMRISEAARRANESQRQVLGNAELNARGQGLGDYFAGATSAYKKANERAEMRRGFGYKGQRSDLWG